MMCDKCISTCVRMTLMLQGHAVPMNALGCDTFGKCDNRLQEELGKLIQMERKKRWKNDQSS